MYFGQTSAIQEEINEKPNFTTKCIFCERERERERERTQSM